MRLIMFFILIQNVVFCQPETENRKDSLAFQIYLADGFENDYIDLSVNSIDIFDSLFLTSNPILGVTNQYVIGYEDQKYPDSFAIETLHLLDKATEMHIKKRGVQLVVVKYMNEYFSFDLDLTEGKYLLVDKHFCYDVITFQQMKTEPWFE